ncbi:adenosylcobinamide-GDP ribazoletransferase [Seleniivibrio sp.]|uniref:adenosylcobinamide-GDP ribazoletransferase n=1 Tax=Seleniivibrio sp. TaxID=2898801 RepID=UPI0025F1316B|nr:adenosylcobinamide-GDP ribazoletransferase [Seleniivibrio sp.]MCD8554340.1 adenosylcobinamide-GDP ribazoletransferase [Seleniivibrio sp.]
MPKLVFPARRCNIFKSYLDALSFLTVIRFKTKDFDGRRAVYSFVPVGLTVGLPLWLFYTYAQAYLPQTAMAVITVLYLVLITGALHLDGLADTADGIFSFRDREKMLEIMKDSRIGTMGAVAIVMTLIVKAFSAYSISNPLYLLVIPAYSRFSMVFGFYMFKYARETGTAAAFFGNFSPLVFAQGILLLCISYFFGAYQFAIFNIAFLIFVYLITRLYKSRIGGITGDMLGAMCESSEAFLFLVAVCLW